VIDIIRRIVLYPVCGFGEEDQIALVHVVHARARHAVTEREVFHAPHHQRVWFCEIVLYNRVKGVDHCAAMTNQNPIDKQALSERDSCTKFITPAIKDVAGCSISRFYEEFIPGKIHVQGGLMAGVGGHDGE
jgi:hypothetical protein